MAIPPSVGGVGAEIDRMEVCETGEGGRLDRLEVCCFRAQETRSFSSDSQLPS